MISGGHRAEMRAEQCLTKLVASAQVIAAAFVAPVITVAGSVVAIGLILAALVAYGVTIQHRLRAGS